MTTRSRRKRRGRKRKRKNNVWHLAFVSLMECQTQAGSINRTGTFPVRFLFDNEGAVKGPSGRLKFDVRRHWRCPRCGRQEASSGKVVVRRCPKCQEPTWMVLL